MFGLKLINKFADLFTTLFFEKTDIQWDVLRSDPLSIHVIQGTILPRRGAFVINKTYSRTEPFNKFFRSNLYVLITVITILFTFNVSIYSEYKKSPYSKHN